MLFVDVQRIRPNPWQTRERIDEAYIQELANDIRGRRASRDATKGLLQVPAGRPVEASGKPALRSGRTDRELQTAIGEGALLVQLAYGHNRWAAFRLLANEDPFYSHMPVDLVEFDDQEMATSAWSENYARRDLTPVEQARAIALMMEDFGWTQQQVAERLGLDRSTVAHKLRLLRLPAEIQAEVQSGAVSERQAMAVLPLAVLPETAVATLPGWQQDRAKQLLQQTGKIDSETLREQVDAVVKAATRNLAEARFPLDWELALDGVRAPRCQGCEQRRGDGCLDGGCYQVRLDEWDRRRLAEVAAAVGATVFDPAEQRKAGYGEYTRFWASDPGGIAFAQQCQCANLRVMLGDYGVPVVEGKPGIVWACTHGERKRCRCHDRATKEEDAAQEVERKARNKAVLQIKKGLVSQLEMGLATGETWALRAVFRRLRHKQGWETMDRPAIVREVALNVVDEARFWENGTAAETFEWATEWIRKLGLNGNEAGEVYNGATGRDGV